MLQPLSRTAAAVTARVAARRAPTAKPAAVSRPFSFSPPSPSRPPPPPLQASTPTSTSTPATTATPAKAKTKAETIHKARLIVLTISCAAVIITGTMYGAGLKTQQEWKAEKKKVQEASVDDKVAMLEQQKRDVMRQKTEIERKLGELRARMKEKAEDAAKEEQARQVANPEKGGGSQ